jgi:hypothetical protein
MSEGALAMTNVTISGNSAAATCGGIFVRDGSAAGTPSVDAINLTLTANTAQGGSGVELQSGALRLKNAIVAHNTGGTDCHQTTTPITSLGFNLDSGTSCGFNSPSDQKNADPKLGPLASNSGPTLTHALLPASPAIDTGDPNVCPATDQRGIARPQDGDGNPPASCDVGAFEAPANTRPPTTSCSPRPPVRVTSTPESPGRLRVTVSTSGIGGALSTLSFGAANNAQIDAPGAPPASTGNFDVSPSAGATSYTFTVRRVTAGRDVQVPFTAIDACGRWPTFVGGGPSAF